jgi:hypothetical protein
MMQELLNIEQFCARDFFIKSKLNILAKLGALLENS